MTTRSTVIFLEHIFHSVNGGLWDEMIWDRSFEGGFVEGSRRSVEDGCQVQDGMNENVRLVSVTLIGLKIPKANME